MLTDQFIPWLEDLQLWGGSMLGVLGIAIGIAMANAIARGLLKAARAYFEPQKAKGKPKRTGEKLKRGDGEVLDIIDEKPKNDANHHRVS